MKIMNVFRKEESMLEQAQAGRSAAIIREELSIARESLAPLGAKLAAAQSELATAQQRYDTGVQGYALGEIRSEPDRAELQSAIARSDALRRVTIAQERSITQLAAELADAELNEATAEELEHLPPVIKRAESKLAEYERAGAALRKAEEELFEALFSESSGLKRRFKNPEIAREVTQVRGSLRVQAQRF